MTVELDVIETLNRHWASVADSSAMSRSLRSWRREFPCVVARSPEELVASVRTRAAGQRDCPVLDALVERARSEELALEVVIQAMLPRWCAIIATTRHPGISRDELAAVVVSLGTESILTCCPGTASTPTDYRLWSDTRHRVHRYLARKHPVREAPRCPAILAVQHAGSTVDVPIASAEDLGRWISLKTGVSMSVARLVATTRLGETTLLAEARAEGAKYATVAQRRARAEQKLRHALTVS